MVYRIPRTARRHSTDRIVDDLSGDDRPHRLGLSSASMDRRSTGLLLCGALLRVSGIGHYHYSGAGAQSTHILWAEDSRWYRGVVEQGGEYVLVDRYRTAETKGSLW